MYAIGLDTYGGPEVLHVLELPDPHPEPGQVRVKVRAAGINPVDVMVRDGSLAQWFADTKPPYVPGMDIAGTIDQVGDEVVSELAVGQHVVGVVDNFGAYGGYSEYVCLPATSVIPRPVGVDFPSAASFLMNALTARNALDALALAQGSSLLVTGAAGAVGAYTVALAAHEGLRVVALAGAGDEGFLRAAGAMEVIARGEDVAAHVHRVFPRGVDAVVDAAGLYEQIAPALRGDGTLITLRPGNDLHLGRGIQTVFVDVRERLTDHAAIVQIGAHVASRLLPLRVAATFPASEAAAAHGRLAEGGLRGRLVLDFGGIADR
ncbi:NADP-dependent oxidoreductase [Frateuria aurantia]|uniref:Zn-dependent oxidoreductase, NADPH:quinone reductase n=1 Tax=Frateuria aurantia (strain ATCC 33424 / DSM 6220 / KCTC 2777 / LMG 1558 / NBRC 3245 / NCIMB 13370) TaxID=767434 RepID=H8L4J6_FRAAD|nr:NADP-dependent oxidoreductase [Frateuria aurantia]AFC85670.1 Zn-dependent oxidoreductase, NADPH:quinone reductase [Frateuria aurantia DSM 6220]